MSKALITLIAVVVFLGATNNITQAQTSNPTIQELLQRLEQLQAQINALRSQQQATTVELIRTLRQGMIGNDVAALQALLTLDSDVYSGPITGYFGRLTAEAVRRYQRKNGLDQVGAVGPRTLQLLRQELRQNPLAIEASTTTATSTPPGQGQGQGRGRLCAHVPPGHLIAPGWLRRNQAPVVPACQTLPPGIQQLIQQGGPGGTATTSTSTPPTALQITSGPTNSSIASTSAHAFWTTNLASNSTVWFGTTSPVATSSAQTVTNAALVTSHDITLTNLSASTTYYYLVGSAVSGQSVISSQNSFTTLPQ